MVLLKVEPVFLRELFKRHLLALVRLGCREGRDIPKALAVRDVPGHDLAYADSDLLRDVIRHVLTIFVNNEFELIVSVWFTLILRYDVLGVVPLAEVDATGDIFGHFVPRGVLDVFENRKLGQLLFQVLHSRNESLAGLPLILYVLSFGILEHREVLARRASHKKVGIGNCLLATIDIRDSFSVSQLRDVREQQHARKVPSNIALLKGLDFAGHVVLVVEPVNIFTALLIFVVGSCEVVKGRPDQAQCYGRGIRPTACSVKFDKTGQLAKLPLRVLPQALALQQLSDLADLATDDTHDDPVRRVDAHGAHELLIRENLRVVGRSEPVGGFFDQVLE
mmetsp:Transcript_29307/g.69763  ORF Transcript_29307/g.69763 Transcript_29307/m.69763 type:complete len:336 (-) Transcript_29307:1163-2170(-)